MLIAIDASRVEPAEKTGVEYYSFYLLQHLKSQVPPEVRVILYSRAPIATALGGLPAQWENRVLGWPPKLLWTQLRLAWQLRRDRPDVLFIPSHLPPLGYGGRSVVTVHDASWLLWPRGYRLLGRWYLRLTTARLARRATAVITVSEWSKRQLEQRYPMLTNKVFVTQLGPTLVSADIGSAASTSRYFVVLGRVERKKNLLVVLEALAELHQRPEFQDIKLLLIGRAGFGATEVAERLLQVDDGRSVEWLGWQPAAVAARYLRGSLALLFPGAYEGFGLPVLDAWNCGVPVVAAASGALPEVVGDAGLLVPPDDSGAWHQAMERLARDEPLRRALVRRGQARLAMFNWAATAASTYQVLALAGYSKQASN